MRGSPTISCSSCGSPTGPDATFCGVCGAPITRQAPAVPAPHGVFTMQEIQARAKKQVLPLVVLGFVGYLDYRLHRQAPVAIVLFVGGMLLTLFLRESAQYVLRTLKIRRLPPWATSLIVTVPAALFFFIRGKGGLSTGDGMLIVAAVIGVPILLNTLAESVDPSLQGYYRTRNQHLPVALRPLVLVIGGLVITFGLIHGNISDIKILWGSTAST